TTGAFEFKDVPVGEYRVSASCSVRTLLSRAVVAPPSSDVVITLADETALVALHVLVSDAETGVSIRARCVIDYDLPERSQSSRDVRYGSDPLIAEVAATGERIRWAVRPEGYRPAFGDESAFKEEGEIRGRPARI